jgi:hypothetical protein
MPVSRRFWVASLGWFLPLPSLFAVMNLVNSFKPAGLTPGFPGFPLAFAVWRFDGDYEIHWPVVVFDVAFALFLPGLIACGFALARVLQRP